MGVVEEIYLVAATLWIVVVLTALGAGCYCVVKVRRRRRSVHRFVKGLRVSLRFGAAAYGKVAPLRHVLIAVLRAT